MCVWRVSLFGKVFILIILSRSWLLILTFVGLTSLQEVFMCRDGSKASLWSVRWGTGLGWGHTILTVCQSYWAALNNKQTDKQKRACSIRSGRGQGLYNFKQCLYVIAVS